MNPFKIVLAFFLIFTTTLFAQNKTVQAAVNIKYLSQKISSDYLLLYHDPAQKDFQKALEKSILLLEQDFRTIAKSTQNEDIKSILDFLSYSKDQIKDLIKDISKKNVHKLLDETDAVVEGVESILSTLHASLPKEELKFHIMKISKLYMAIHLKFNPSEYTAMLHEELQLTDKILHQFPADIYQLWQNYKTLYDPSSHYFIPHIVSIATEDLLRSLKKL